MTSEQGLRDIKERREREGVQSHVFCFSKKEGRFSTLNRSSLYIDLNTNSSSKPCTPNQIL